MTGIIQASSIVDSHRTELGLEPSSISVDKIVDGRTGCWATFRDSGTMAMDDNYNITSETDHATGDYSFTMTNAFDNINGYAQNGLARHATNTYTMCRNSNRDSESVMAFIISNTAGTRVNSQGSFIANGTLA